MEYNLQRLSAAGISIALDDFGTGYASFSHLTQFPIDIIKIDRCFIRDLETNPDDDAIVRIVLNLAYSLGIRTVAEGVENENQRLSARRRMSLWTGLPVRRGGPRVPDF